MVVGSGAFTCIIRHNQGMGTLGIMVFAREHVPGCLIVKFSILSWGTHLIKFTVGYFQYFIKRSVSGPLPLFCRKAIRLLPKIYFFSKYFFSSKSRQIDRFELTKT